MLDRESFMKDLEELESGDPCQMEYYLNKTFMDLKDGNDDCGGCCCGYGQFSGGEDTKDFEALLARDKEYHRRSDIAFVLKQLIAFYSLHKPELVPAVESVRAQYL